MKTICSWCRKDMGGGPDDGPVSHGICVDCADRLFGNMGTDLGIFLDNLEAPVLLVGDDVRVKTANSRARAILDKELKDIAGCLGGDVFECIHASLEGGCGKTMHCSGCAIRNTVMDTFKTGNSHLKTPAYLHRGIPEHERKTDLLISTEKVKDCVLLRIDDVRAA